MPVKLEDLLFNLNASNTHLRVLMNSNVSYDLRAQAHEQLQRNLRAMGTDEAVIAAIQPPCITHGQAKPQERSPWKPDYSEYPRTFEDPHPIL